MEFDENEAVGAVLLAIVLWVALGAYIAMALVFILVALVVGYLKSVQVQDEEV